MKRGLISGDGGLGVSKADGGIELVAPGSGAGVAWRAPNGVGFST